MNQAGGVTTFAALGRLGARISFALCLCLAAATSHAQALRPLPPDFLAVLAEMDAAVANVGTGIRRFRSEDMGFRSPSASQLDEALARMDRGIAQVKTQAEDLRRRESLLLLLAIKGTLGGFASDMAGFVSLMQSATVRSPVALERLNREIAELEKNAQAVNAAFRKFDTGAQALLERLDRQAGAQK